MTRDLLTAIGGAALSLTLAAATTGCSRPECGGHFYTCTSDDRCHPPERPPGYCLDVGEGYPICAIYFYNCPSHYRWDDCGGHGETKSSWAGRCVREWQLPDFGTADGGADASPPPPDMSVELDGPGPG